MVEYVESRQICKIAINRIIIDSYQINCFAKIALTIFFLLFLSSSQAAVDSHTCTLQPSSSDNAPPIALTIRATSALPTEAIRWIAQFSEPATINLKSGINPEKIIMQKCGHFSDDYWSELEKLPMNKGIRRAPSHKDRQIALPACVYWANDVIVNILPGDTLDNLLIREIGLSSTDILSSCVTQYSRKNRCDRSLEKLVQSRNPGLNLENLDSKKYIKLPLITRATTINLRSNCFTDINVASSALNKIIIESENSIRNNGLLAKLSSNVLNTDQILKKGVLGGDNSFPHIFGSNIGIPITSQQLREPESRAEESMELEQRAALASIESVAEQASIAIESNEILNTSKSTSLVSELSPSNYLGLVNPLSSTEIKSNFCSEARTFSSSEWPFNSQILIKKLKESIKKAKEFDNHLPNRTVVGIIDSGIDGKLLPLKTYGWWMNRECTKELDPKKCRGIRNFDDDGNKLEDEIYGLNIDRKGDVEYFPNYKNALHGTQVADLALGGYEFRKSFADLPDVIRIRIYRALKQVLGKAVNIDDGALNSLITNSLRDGSKVSIINISLATDVPMNSFLLLAKNTEEAILFVVAAGNDNQFLENENYSLFPANYGGQGELRKNLITVAAHDGRGQLAEFSNWGNKNVDIAAPGCQLSFIKSEAESEELYGTSFAAPLVTFAAALIRSLGIDKPSDIKTRLLTASDYDEKLEGKVFAGGRLNIIKAISIYEDVLTLNNEDMLFGTWLDLDNKEALCEEKNINPAVKYLLKIRPEVNEQSIYLNLVLRNKDGLNSTKRCIPQKKDGLSFKIMCKESDSDCIDTERFFSWKEIRELTTRYQ